MVTYIICFTFCIVLALAAFICLRGKSVFSLEQVFGLFTFFFLGAAPLLQFLLNTHPFPWFPQGQSDALFLKANCIIIVSEIIWLAIYKSNCNGVVKTDFFIPFPKRGATVVFAMALAAQMILAPDLFRRLPDKEMRFAFNSSLQLLLDKSLKGIVLTGFLWSLVLWLRRQISNKIFALIFIGVATANFPTAVPRYWSAVLYGGGFITVLLHRFPQKIYAFRISAAVAIVLIFPLLSTIRQKQTISEQPIAASFCGQDFDGHAALRNALLYTDQNGFAMGRQALTDALFFVPRFFWPEKSVGTGSVINPPKPGSDFNNYAAPLWAEAWFDFGWAGVVLFAGLLALLCRRLDANRHQNFLALIYPALAGMLFFFLRGDALSSVAYAVGILACGIVFFRLAARQNAAERF